MINRKSILLQNKDNLIATNIHRTKSIIGKQISIVINNN